MSPANVYKQCPYRVTYKVPIYTHKNIPFPCPLWEQTGLLPYYCVGFNFFKQVCKSIFWGS